MRFLVVYGTTDGHTARVAEYLGWAIQKRGHQPLVVSTDDLPDEPLESFDAILVGGSLHAGGYQRGVKRFIRRNLDVLRTRPTAFFSVCLAIVSRKAESRDEARMIPRRFVARYHWLPDHVEAIAGALSFSRYGFLRRMVMKRITEAEMGPPVDTTRDQVFTDWDRVDQFGGDFVNLVEVRAERRARTAPRWPAAATGMEASP